MMPTYDYICQQCFETFDIQISIAEYAKGVSPKCPKCGALDTLRAFSPVHVVTGKTAPQNVPRPDSGGGCCGGSGCCG
jgi:putative FmdB family regulatory protein